MRADDVSLLQVYTPEALDDGLESAAASFIESEGLPLYEPIGPCRVHSMLLICHLEQ